MRRAAALALAAVLATGACTRNAAEEPQPARSDGGLPVVTVAALDFPSAWLAETVGGDAVEVVRVGAADVGTADTDLVAYVKGISADVDEAVGQLPSDQVVDVSADTAKIASPRDVDVKDPYLWFDPVNVGTMAQTLGTAMGEANERAFEAYQYYGLRALDVQTQALDVDQFLQERLNPCRIETLVVEAPVLQYMARAYALTLVPLIEYKPAEHKVQALYYTLDAQAAVEKAASSEGVKAVAVDTLTEGAPEDDLLQGVLSVGEAVADHQNCPLVTPSASDRPR